MLTIEAATNEEDLAMVRTLFREYAESLDFDLCFQDFDEELARLPGRYAPPSGALLLARVNDTVAGCVGLRRLEDDICEMKRLYVRPFFRRQGVGRALAQAILDAARSRGYHRMRLDTVASMTPARSLYRSLGFYEIEPYCHNPLDEAVHMECMLTEAPAEA